MFETTLFPVVVSSVVAGVVLPTAALRRMVRAQHVHAFARLNNLALTPAGTALVVRYLLVTRRWRAACLAVTASLALAPLLTALLVRGTDERPIGVILAATVAVSGWFLGALIAELRLTVPPPGGEIGAKSPASDVDPLAAHLTGPRRGWDAVPWLACALVTAIAVVGLRLSPAADHRSTPWSLTVVGIVVAVTVGAAAIARRVRRRPSPTGVGADLRELDRALRRHSLRVLNAAAVAVAGLGAATLIAVSPWSDRPAAIGLAVIVAAVCTLGVWSLTIGPAGRSRPMTAAEGRRGTLREPTRNALPEAMR